MTTKRDRSVSSGTRNRARRDDRPCIPRRSRSTDDYRPVVAAEPLLWRSGGSAVIPKRPLYFAPVSANYSIATLWCDAPLTLPGKPAVAPWWKLPSLLHTMHCVYGHGRHLGGCLDGPSQGGGNPRREGL